MAKQKWKPGNMVYPLPAVLVSCGDKKGNINVMTAAWTGTICSDPPMVYVSVRKERYSHHMIQETREYVINLTTEKLAWTADFCGVRSGRDLDKFKEANDTFGHATGDKILIEFGDILTKIMPESAVIARLGGDEFAVLLPGVSENQAEFLIKLVQAEMTLKDMGITASLGAYTDSYQSHKNFVDFFAIADKKMYENKSQKGKSNV